jgi:vacuolar-type H+-ATPase subunit H
MVTAQEEIDRIHQAEEAAKQLIEEANAKAREMKQETEAKVSEIMDQHEKEATQEAERLLKEKEDKKVKIEGKVLKSADSKIAEYNDVLKKKQNAAIDAVLKIVLGEA